MTFFSSPKTLPLWRTLALFFLTTVCMGGISSAFAQSASSTDVFTPAPAMRIETLTGFTRAGTVMTMVSESAGKALTVAAEVGETIGPEQVFAQLDTTFIKLDIKDNNAERARLESQIAYYEKEASRYRNLVKKKSAAQSSLDKLEHELEQAKLTLKALNVKDKRLSERLTRHTIHAPQGFSVMERDIEPGEWINVGQKVGKLGDYRTLAVPFALDPTEYQWLMEKQGKVILRAPDIKDQNGRPVTVEASLKKIFPAFDAQTRKSNLELSITSHRIPHRGGVRMELDIQRRDRAGSVLVPTSSVVSRYEEHKLIRPDGTSIKVVVLGERSDGRLRVFSPDIKPDDVFLRAPGEK